jgi:histidyl-tRNA synthetase
MFRYERPQAGRFRQFHQLDVEALGDDHPSLDAEVIAMLVELFQRLDLAKGLQVEINSLGDENPECRPRYRTELVRYLREHADRLCDECRERTERNPLRVLDCKRPECRPVLDRAPALAGFLCPDCAAHFAKTREYLEVVGVRYVVSPRLVRGLDYYVRTTFELTTTELGAQNAVAGGGRYDGLIKLLGGPPDPGIGFAVGVERVVQLLPDEGPEAWEGRRPMVFAIPLGDEALKRLLPIAAALRASNIIVELGHGERKLAKELERASKLEQAKRVGALYAVILGPDELARNVALVKDMKSGEQRPVPLDRLAQELAGLSRRR